MMLRATKRLTYRTRRLLPGDVFEVTRPQDARILKAIRKAEDHVEIEDSPREAPAAPVVDPAPTPPVPARDPLNHDGDGHKGGSVAQPRTEDLAAVRAEYEAVVGKRAYHGWTADDLRQKIADHKADAQS